MKLFSLILKKMGLLLQISPCEFKQVFCQENWLSWGDYIFIITIKVPKPNWKISLKEGGGRKPSLMGDGYITVIFNIYFKHTIYRVSYDHVLLFGNVERRIQQRPSRCCVMWFLVYWHSLPVVLSYKMLFIRKYDLSVQYKHHKLIW